ncbi:MAG: alpha/beta hydrolase [Gudongella sp.]|nr:alpha/beta hydrolase [Gudongella sp.]
MSFKDLKNNTNPIIYKSRLENTKGNILYFHGGGFIFGSNDDLPDYHIKMITEAGYDILSFNYPLSPESDFKNIIQYIIETINQTTKYMNKPYFLWGRSSGAYLCLLVVSKDLYEKPSGIISYYGYGFLLPKWYDTPSSYYLKYPPIEYNSVKNLIQNEIILSAPINPRFLLYLYARQTGNWLKTISDLTTENFLDRYSLLNTNFDHYPPVLLVHNTRDNDVPYEESFILSTRISNSKLITFSTLGHDFDKDTTNINTLKLIKETIQFLDNNTAKAKR